MCDCQLDVGFIMPYYDISQGVLSIFFCQAEDGIRDLVRSRGLGDVYKRQGEIALEQVAERVVHPLHLVVGQPAGGGKRRQPGNLSLIHI